MPDLLHECVDEHARRDPLRVAVRESDRTLTYGELRRRSDRIAARLSHFQIGPESLVAVHLPRSIDLIVALVGVLKSGGAYLALSTDDPPARLAAILDDARPALAIGRNRIKPPVDDLPIVAVDDLLSVGATGEGQATCPTRLPATGLCYVIYTSGSTGRPKGVSVTHRNAVNLIRGQTYAAFSPEDVFLQLAPLTFDAAAYEIWGALANGAELVLTPSSYAAYDDLDRVVREHGVTNLLLTPLVFHELVRSRSSALSGVKRLLVGGEAMSAARAREFVSAHRLERVTLVNAYGPTEATTLVCTFDLCDPAAIGTRVPLGRPIANASLYVLDDRLRHVGEGATGEIYIGGLPVTRGYRDDPRLTALRFVPDPHSGVASARMYRTGDLACYTQEGQIEFLGRVDDQVKIRGHRIELSELDAALLEAPGVLSGAAWVRQSNDLPPQLVASVVLEGGASGVGEVAAHLADVLPRYLVPSQVYAVEAIPITSAGKVDRDRLATAVVRQGPARGAAPMSETEAVITEIWRTVLGVEAARDDNFYAIGGDSILAIRVIAEAEDRGLSLSLKDFFEHPTIADMSAVATQVEDSTMPVRGPAEEARPCLDDADAYPASAMQIGLIYDSLSQRDMGRRSLPAYHDVVTRTVTGPFVYDALVAAVEHLASRHPSLRTEFDFGGDDGGYQTLSSPAIPIAVADLTSCGEAEISRTLALHVDEAARAIDAELGPLLRIDVHLLDANRFQLTYAFHHAILDGWSEAIFIAELMRCYDAYIGGDPPPQLPALPATPRDFVCAENEAIADPQTRAFWTAELTSKTPTRLRRGSSEVAGSLHRLRSPIAQDDVRQLATNAKSVGVPLKSALQAIHLVVVGQLTNAVRPVSGVVTNARLDLPGADRMIGLFLNVVPYALDLDVPRWRDLWRAALEYERKIWRYRRFPYPEMVRLIDEPLFDTAFNYVQFHANRELDELQYVRVSDARFFDSTGYALLADFVRDPRTNDMTVQLATDASIFDWSASERLGVSYARVLAAAAASPDASPRDCLVTDEKDLPTMGSVKQ